MRDAINEQKNTNEINYDIKLRITNLIFTKFEQKTKIDEKKLSTMRHD